MRKASYAERDRLRSIDPGIVDFADEDDDEEADIDDDLDNEHVGGRARQRALKIIEARNSVPAAGMFLFSFLFFDLSHYWHLTIFSPS